MHRTLPGSQAGHHLDAGESPGESSKTPGNRNPRERPRGHQAMRPARTPIMATHAKLSSIQVHQDTWANINGALATNGRCECALLYPTAPGGANTYICSNCIFIYPVMHMANIHGNRDMTAPTHDSPWKTCNRNEGHVSTHRTESLAIYGNLPAIGGEVLKILT